MIANFFNRLQHVLFPQIPLGGQQLKPLQKVLLLAGLTLIFSLLGLLLPAGGMIGFDWVNFFGIGRVPEFYPPWVSWVIAPLTWPLLIGIGLASFAVAVIERTMHRFSAAVAFFCLPLLWTLFLGQLEGIVLLGLLGLPWLVPLVLIKPQVSLFALGARRASLVVLAFWLLLSVLLFGPWYERMLNVETYYAEGRYPQNIGLGWWGLPFFAASVWFSRGDPDMLMLSGAFISPHIIPYNFLPFCPAIARLKPAAALVAVILSWLPVLFANRFGPPGWWSGWLLPLWLWANLAMRRYTQYRLQKPMQSRSDNPLE